MLQRRPCLLLLLRLSTVSAYGEGNAHVDPVRWTEALSWDPDSEVSDCAVVSAGTPVDARLLVALPADASELAAHEVCVHYTVRSDTAENWWFVAPPAAEPPLLACAPAKRSRSRPVTIALEGLRLPRGYTRLAAWLHQPRYLVQTAEGHAVI